MACLLVAELDGSGLVFHNLVSVAFAGLLGTDQLFALRLSSNMLPNWVLSHLLNNFGSANHCPAIFYESFAYAN